MGDTDWSNIPIVPLVRIFSYLSDFERSEMSLACRAWNRCFQDPTLWKRRKWVLSGYEVPCIGRRACHFAKYLGHNLRYLTIKCDRCSFNVYQSYHEAIQSLLLALHQKTKLKEFRLVGLRAESYCYSYKDLLDSFVDTLVKFLKGQKSMDVVDVSQAQFYYPEGCRVLEAVAHSCGKTLRYLQMDAIFHPTSASPVMGLNRYRRAMASFKNLRYLAFNYRGMSDEMLRTFAENLSGKLKCLKVIIDRSPVNEAGVVSPDSWKLLHRACPNIHVKLFIRGFGHISEIVPILAPEIPLHELFIYTGPRFHAEWRLSSTLLHIAINFPRTLEICHFKFDNNTEPVDEQLFSLVKQCTALRELTVNAVFDVSFADDVCGLQQRNEIHLRKFHVANQHLSSDKKQELKDLFRQKYARMVFTRDLDFQVDSELALWDAPTLLIPLQPVRLINMHPLGGNGNPFGGNRNPFEGNENPMEANGIDDHGI